MAILPLFIHVQNNYLLCHEAVFSRFHRDDLNVSQCSHSSANIMEMDRQNTKEFYLSYLLSLEIVS